MEIKLNASLRDGTTALSKDDVLAVIYGPGVNNRNLVVKSVDLEKAFMAAGESSLIELNINGENPVKVIIKDTQRHPLKSVLRHVDFYQVNMTKKITTEIPLRFIGESRAIKELGGMLVKSFDAIEVECLPSDLVNHIDVDISVITELHHGIKVSDLKLPKGMKVLTDLEETVTMVVEPKVEEVVAAPVVEAAPVASDKKEPAKDEEKK